MRSNVLYSMLPTSSAPPSPTLAYFPLRYVYPPRSYRSNLIVGLACLTLVSLSALLGILVFDPPPAIASLPQHWWHRAEAGEASETDTIEMLRSMVEQTEGYYARDWSLWLGWNNVRYILETSLLHASLLNRTLIIPSHVYMRSCEYDHSVCAAFAKQVNRGDAVGTDEWRQLPEDQQQAWVMPIGRMVDLDRLREAGLNLVTGEEFSLLERVRDWELGNGSFPLELPMPERGEDDADTTYQPLTIYHIPNSAYEPNNTLLIDRPLPPPPILPPGSAPIIQQTLDSLKPLLESLHDGIPVAWKEASTYVKRDLGYGIGEDDVETAIRWAGFARIYSLGSPHDMSKTVATPSSYLIDPSKVVSFTQDFGGRKERILHLEGEVHLARPPGAMYFSSAQAANDFATMTVRDVRPVREVELLGERVARRMDERVGGRMWTAAHMRRGDFVRYGWAPAQSLEIHLASIRYQLDHGRQLLDYIQMHGPPRKPRISGFESDGEIWKRDPAEDDDPYYLATDDRDPASLALIRATGGLLLSDLLTPSDREEFVGWPLLFTDVLGQVEQEVMARAAFFYGSALSSVSGGVMNGRVVTGKDPRTSELS